MQDLKQKLADQGLVGTLTIRETGQKIPLRFARGETKKLCKLELGPTSVDVELCLVEVAGAKPDQPNLTLSINTGGPAVIESADTTATQTKGVDDAAKAEAEAKAAAEAEAKAKAEADEAERVKAAELTKEAEAKAKAEADAKATATTPVETPTSSSQPATTSSAKSGGDKKGRT